MALQVREHSRPPSRRWVGASRLNGDKRIYGLVAGVIVLFGIAILVPLARQEFRIFVLHSLADYGVVALCLAAWYLALLMIWRVIWPLKRTQTGAGTAPTISDHTD